MCTTRWRSVSRTMVILAAAALGAGGVDAQSISHSAFSYQGRLNAGAQGYNGGATFRCTLYDNETDGTAMAGPLTVTGSVVGGIFTIPLDFGVMEPQRRRWLEVEVSTPANPGFQLLTPRQPVDVVPRAASALRAEMSEPFVPAFNPSPMILDQVQTVSDSNAVGPSGSIWQSFTTGNGGNLTHIVVYRNDGANYGGLTLNIYLGTGSGGQKLWSQRCVAMGGVGEIVLPLTRALLLDAGTTYTFEIVAGGGLPFYACSSANPYAGGRCNLGPAVDLYFKTYYGFPAGDLSLRSRFFGINEGTPNAPLHVTGGSEGNPFPQIRVTADAAAPYGAFLSLDATRVSAGHDWLMFSSGGSAGEGAGKLVFRDLTSENYGLTMASNGFIGVRNFNPDYALDVLASEYTAQRIQSTNIAGTWLALGNLSPGGRYWNMVSTGSGNGEGAGKFLLSPGSTPVSLDAYALALTATGLLGVNNSDPQFSVDVIRSGDGNVFRGVSDGASTILTLTNTSANGRNYSLMSNGTSGTFAIRDNTSISDRLTVYPSGRVGIGGTTNPAGFLDVTGNGSSTIAVVGRAGPGPNAVGIYGTATGPGTKAGQFDGNVTINGSLTVVGSVSKTSGSFRIPHPLEPEKKWLYHSFVESPDMMNIYNGVIRLDEKGEAAVRLPGYFEALNHEFRYQLTPVGAPMPDLYVAEEISANSFKIAGGKPGAKVSWQVTGIRQDKDAREHPIVPEVERTDLDN